MRSSWYIVFVLVLVTGIVGAASAQLSGHYRVTWTDNSTNEDGFRVERRDGAATNPWNQVVQTLANVTVFDDSPTAAVAGQQACYRVKAFNNFGSATPSPEACITPILPPAAGGTTVIYVVP